MELSVAVIQQAYDEKAVQHEKITTEEGRICQRYDWKSHSPKSLGLDVNLAWIWKEKFPSIAEYCHWKDMQLHQQCQSSYPHIIVQVEEDDSEKVVSAPLMGTEAWSLESFVWAELKWRETRLLYSWSSNFRKGD